MAIIIITSNNSLKYLANVIRFAIIETVCLKKKKWVELYNYGIQL